MHPRRRFISRLVALVALFAAACGPPVQEPEVRFEGVRVGSLGLEGGLLYVRIGVENPNRFAVAASAIHYDLDIRRSEEEGEWVELAEGSFVRDLQVGGRDSVIVEIPVEFTYREIGPVVRAVLQRGSLSYRVSGSVDVVSPIRRSFPFRHSGSATLSSRRASSGAASRTPTRVHGGPSPRT